MQEWLRTHLALSCLLWLHTLFPLLGMPFSSALVNSSSSIKTPTPVSSPPGSPPRALRPSSFPLAPPSLHRARGVCGFHHNDLGTLGSAPPCGSKDGSYSHLQEPPNSWGDWPTQSHMPIIEPMPESVVTKGSTWPDLVTCPHPEPRPGCICPPKGKQGELSPKPQKTVTKD